MCERNKTTTTNTYENHSDRESNLNKNEYIKNIHNLFLLIWTFLQLSMRLKHIMSPNGKHISLRLLIVSNFTAARRVGNFGC